MATKGTGVNNLRKDTSGIYYALLKINGKQYLRSLGKDCMTREKAIARLPAKLEEIRNEVAPRETGVELKATATFGDAYAVYEADVNSDPKLKPSTRSFRLRQAAVVRRHWAKLFDMELRKVTPAQLDQFMRDFQNGGSRFLPHRAKKKTVAGDSATVVNAVISFFQRVFGVGVKAGIISRNPAQDLERKEANSRRPMLPNKTQFAAVIAHIRSQNGHGRSAADLVEGLAYTGMRLRESHSLTWQHLDFENEGVTEY